PINDNFLDEAEKAAILDNLEDDNRFHLSAEANLLFNFKHKKQRFSIGARQRSLAYAQFNNPDLMGLVLLGNAAYEGETVRDEDILLRIQSYSELSFATAAQKDKWSYGLRLKFLFANNLTNLDLRSFELFTEEFGTEVRVASNFEYDRTSANGLGGFGAGVDLGVNYQINEKLSAQASIVDLGFISWRVDKILNSLNTSYEGVFIEDITNVNISDDESIFASDSLERLFFPDTISTNSSIYLPAFGQVGLSYVLGQKSSLGVLLRWGFFRDSPLSTKAQISGIYQYHFSNWLKGGIHTSIGGLEGFEAGALLAGNIPLGKKQDLKIFCQSDKLWGFINPKSGKGQTLQIGLIFQY
ncbi:MAG: DUF5723 family protein, partial [Bacteroidota bacterium]